MFPRIALTRSLAILSASLLISVSVLGAQDGMNMKVTDNGYLDTRGFSVILYQSVFHPVFVDQKNTAMELILHGQRIATNGDVRLMPTPEQWDLVAQLKGRQADKEHNRLTAQLSFPTYEMDYELVVTPEPGGVRVSVNLAKPLPEKLAGRAGFNLEFLPSIYMGKAYLVDGSKAGIFPRTPNDPMIKVMPLADEPKKAYYLEDWDKAKGYTQPLPFAQGKSITLDIDDALARVNVKSDTADLMLFDGRDRAQNGWFVLRSLIPSGKTTDAIVWHIRPDVIPNWTRPPMIAHSQVGYAPDFSKVAVLELDPKYNGPQTAKVMRLMEDGSYKQVFEGPLTPATPWIRYVYSKFDFTPVKDPGLYVIEYADQRTAPFPISKDAYANIWQDSLDHHLAVQMDHVSVREGYRIWHGASHLDDGRMAPVVGGQFDGWSQPTATDGKYKGGDHIPGMNVGGWYDAGDFDLEEPSELNVIQSLALAYRQFGLKYDELTVDETAREVEMHRPDGVPDAVEQVKHGALLILAQFHNIGHAIRGTHEPDLRQYTHLGDAASKTDGRIYDPTLGPNEVKGDYSGKPDDRWIFTGTNPSQEWNAIASLAAAADVLKGWDDAMAKDCLDTAAKAWADEKANPTPNPGRGGFGGGAPGGGGGGVLAASQGGAAGGPVGGPGAGPGGPGDFGGPGGTGGLWRTRRAGGTGGLWRTRRAGCSCRRGDRSCGRCSGRLRRRRRRSGRLWRRTGLGCGSGNDHRHTWRRALQVPSEGVVPPDDHPAADGRSWLDGGAGIALPGRGREGSDARSGEDLHGDSGQAVGCHPVRRAPQPGYLGRFRRRGGHGCPDVLPARDLSGSCGPRIYPSRRQLHSRHAPGIQHFVCSRRRHSLEDEDVQQQPRRQLLYSGRRHSGIHHHQARFSGANRRLRIPLVRG